MVVEKIFNSIENGKMDWVTKLYDIDTHVTIVVS